ncbi:hypothetical protein [Acanthopleuribacter pedis]|uniref:Uncharacterized protein n=1 Tax=Acanthopleuribacter pedis TaxID=442870 RepID=A0A8J7Q6A1_9BACT|nr:hypothetical protein [Acanthopleuribacter pedis]MBO1318871.1 hypothetical protein [Acanthopleuribacter pedis]
MEDKILELMAQIGGFFPGTLTECCDALARAFDTDQAPVEAELTRLVDKGAIRVDAVGVRLDEDHNPQLKRFRKVKKHRG